MYMHTPKDPLFASKNRLPSAEKVWRLLLDESKIHDVDTSKSDSAYARGELVQPWVGGETDYFTEQLERPVTTSSIS